MDERYVVFGMDSAGPEGLDRWYVRSQLAGEKFGATLVEDHWHEVKLVMDFSVSGGSGTLYHRDLTQGETAWTLGIQPSLT